MPTYNITIRGSTGTQFHCTLEEDVITIVELEHVQVDIVTVNERNTGLNVVKITTKYVAILTAAEIFKICTVKPVFNGHIKQDMILVFLLVVAYCCTKVAQKAHA